MTRKQRYVISVLIPVVILLGMTVLPIKTLLFGKEVLLETRPLDPRDLFRGDYVTLRYAIEEIDIDKVEPDLVQKFTSFNYPYNQSLYVELIEKNGVFVVKAVTEKRPSSPSVYLEARHGYITNLTPSDTGESSKLMVTYAFDRYFVEENTGMALEEAARKGELLARIKVYNGYGLLQEILIQK